MNTSLKVPGYLPPDESKYYIDASLPKGPDGFPLAPGAGRLDNYPCCRRAWEVTWRGLYRTFLCLDRAGEYVAWFFGITSPAFPETHNETVKRSYEESQRLQRDPHADVGESGTVSPSREGVAAPVAVRTFTANPLPPARRSAPGAMSSSSTGSADMQSQGRPFETGDSAPALNAPVEMVLCTVSPGAASSSGPSAQVGRPTGPHDTSAAGVDSGAGCAVPNPATGGCASASGPRSVDAERGSALHPFSGPPASAAEPA
eukprot:TRINITY_DN35901_c0_g1_i1.p1 TRINITY_DN35901_c0_g1~~TRINITY_DN35901_c0_g1_i1.p1  ORF type:complete len:259 (+),score=11.19 TRINITY_DN35901_c0_g1_i1:153-929(+)